MLVVLMFLAVFVVSLYCGCQEATSNKAELKDLQHQVKTMEKEKSQQQQINQLNKKVDDLNKKK
jgi:cell division protein FtsB